MDEEGLERALGLVLGLERGEQFEEPGGVLFGDDGVAGEQAVADGVEDFNGASRKLSRPDSVPTHY